MFVEELAGYVMFVGELAGYVMFVGEFASCVMFVEELVGCVMFVGEGVIGRWLSGGHGGSMCRLGVWERLWVRVKGWSSDWW